MSLKLKGEYERRHQKKTEALHLMRNSLEPHSTSILSSGPEEPFSDPRHSVLPQPNTSTDSLPSTESYVVHSSTDIITSTTNPAAHLVEDSKTEQSIRTRYPLETDAGDSTKKVLESTDPLVTSATHPADRLTRDSNSNQSISAVSSCRTGLVESTKGTPDSADSSVILHVLKRELEAKKNILRTMKRNLGGTDA